MIIIEASEMQLISLQMCITSGYTAAMPALGHDLTHISCKLQNGVQLFRFREVHQIIRYKMTVNQSG